MLSLAQTASYRSEGSDVDVSITARPHSTRDPENERGRLAFDEERQNQYSFNVDSNPFQPTPRWGSDNFLGQFSGRETATAFEGLKASTPPVNLDKSEEEGSGSASPMEIGEMDYEARSPLKWMPSHMQPGAGARRKGKAKMEDIDCGVGLSSPHPNQLHPPPFTGRPLPGPLLATLLSESAPLEHEMRSEARLQRMLSSHHQALPFTPRAPRSSRGRFPETVDDDDDEHDPSTSRWSSARRSWMGRGSIDDSDSDEETGAPEPVNSAFAAGMDMDRPGSSSSSGMGMSAFAQESGRNTPALPLTMGTTSAGTMANSNQPTPPSQSVPWPGAGVRSARMSFGSAGAGMVPSPGSGLGLPGAFGGLGMGIGTPLASPTLERLEVGLPD